MCLLFAAFEDGAVVVGLVEEQPAQCRFGRAHRPASHYLHHDNALTAHLPVQELEQAGADVHWDSHNNALRHAIDRVL